MKKLGVPRMKASRTANCISFFVALRRENLRILDKLFKCLSKISVDSTNFVTVIDSSGGTGSYDYPSENTRQSIYFIAYVLGFTPDEINAYVNKK